MAKTRDNYTVTGNSVPELINSLNFLFQRLQDRMDKIEGIRGQPSIEADLTMNNSVIADVGGGLLTSDAARLADLSDYAQTAQTETISGTWTFQQNTTFEGDVIVQDDAVLVYDANGTLIHSLGI